MLNTDRLTVHLTPDIWCILVLLTFIFDKNNDSVGKDVSIRAGKSNEKCFVVFFREFVLKY